MSLERRPPSFFAAVRDEALEDWDTLEKKPVLAAPWWQLFRQVKSPYHVLSEVLQNADDAGATWARAWIEDGAFHFEHNGGDFEEAHLRSLCRFGFSNKRHLHTIGFRGLGFKSLFSYGARVEVTTPTLAVAFEESRFTEPVWVDDAPPMEHTRIRVVFTDQRIAERAQDDVARWADDPVPLLFFRSIRRLELGGQTVSRNEGASGPAPHSRWVELRGASTERVLLVRSPEMAVPAEALEEIRQERSDPSFELPAVSVDIVVGLPAPDRIYVVLPTTVELPMPFSCNAPFIQDPARSGIKDPVNSSLNRWLLERIGTLAAETLSAWVANTTLPLDERAEAYGNLLPDLHPPGSSAGAIAARQITAGIAEALRGAEIVLTTDGALVVGESALELPSDLAQVWTSRDALRLLGDGKTSILASEVAEVHRRRLALWAGLTRTSQQDIIARLRTAPLVPCPALDRLTPLWAFLEPALQNNQWQEWIRELQIVPVRGEPGLRRASEVTTFGEDGDKLADEDWEFLRSLMRALDPAWASLLVPVGKEPGKHDATLRAAAQVLKYLKLDETASVAQLVSRGLSTQGATFDVAVGVRLARIAAMADIQLDGQFRYRTEKGQWRTAAEGLVLRGGVYEDLFPSAWAEAHCLHSAYEEGLSSEKLRIWRDWMASPKSRVRGFPLPEEREGHHYGQDAARQGCAARGVKEFLYFHLATPRIIVSDRDFPVDFWRHWHSLSHNDRSVYARVVDAIGSAWDSAMAGAAKAAMYQDGTQYRRKVSGSDMPASWLHQLRGLPCVLNQHGAPCLPSTLLRHTADTSFLHAAEDFVHPEVDRAVMHPLLDLLGVRTQAFGADRLLDRLRALARTATVQTHAVHPLYTALDQLVARLPADAVRGIRDVFAKEALALGDDLAWYRSESLYQRNDESLPGAPPLWGPTAGFTLWQRLGVPTRPSIEKLLAWLSTLPSGERLEELQRRRIRELLGALPRQVWDTCRAWLDLSGRWVTAPALRWRVSRTSTAEGLFTKLRHATADLSMVADEALHESLFADLAPLERALTRRPMPKSPRSGPGPEWLHLLAVGLSQATALRESTDQDAHPRADSDRLSAYRLERASWCLVEEIAVTPFIDGEQAGAASDVRAAWFEDTVYVCGTPTQHHRELVEELRRTFADLALRDAVNRSGFRGGSVN